MVPKSRKRLSDFTFTFKLQLIAFIYMVSTLGENHEFFFNKPSRYYLGFPGGSSGKESSCQWRRCKRCGFNPWVGKILWSRKWQSIPVFLPRKAHGRRSLAGYNSPWGRKESDMTEQLSTRHYSVNDCSSTFSNTFEA